MRNLVSFEIYYFFSHEDEQGVRRVLGETISHTGYIIMILQIFVSRFAEKARAMPTFMLGLFVAAAGMVVLGLAYTGAASLVFLGIFLFVGLFEGELTALAARVTFVAFQFGKC